MSINPAVPDPKNSVRESDSSNSTSKQPFAHFGKDASSNKLNLESSKELSLQNETLATFPHFPRFDIDGLRQMTVTPTEEEMTAQSKNYLDTRFSNRNTPKNLVYRRPYPNTSNDSRDSRVEPGPCCCGCGWIVFSRTS